MDLSVLIPVYNAGTLIDRCMDSVFAQKGGYEVEVLCVDDGSTDNSVELIKSRKEFNIILLQQENSGPAKARNKALRKASGRYIAYLDADDFWLLGFIEKTVSFLDAHPECIAVSTGQRHITLSGDHIAPTYIQEDGHSTEPFILDDFFSFWAKYNHVCTGSITIRREVALEVGGQREELRSCEDLEFWALLSTYGSFGFIPEVLFVSNGGKVTREQGWVSKMMVRWQNAPSIADWQKRLIPRLGKEFTEGFKRARGRIAGTVIYDKLLSDRVALAREEALMYGDDFPKNDKAYIIMNIAKHSSLLWGLLAKALRYREYHRKIDKSLSLSLSL